MTFALRQAFHFLTAPVWKNIVIGPTFNLTAKSTDDQFESYIKRNTGTVFHPVGTAAMSAEDAKFGVVNPDLRVKGVTGLRIADASIFVCIDFNWQVSISEAHEGRNAAVHSHCSSSSCCLRGRGEGSSADQNCLEVETLNRDV